MRKIIINLLTIFLMICLITFCNNTDDCEHHHTIHAASAYPYCGGTLILSPVAGTPATCTTSGTENYVCDCGCGYSETRTVAPLGHHYVQTSYDAPTCTESGSASYKCDRISVGAVAECGSTYTETISATGHTYKVLKETKVTCTEDGYIKEECTTCHYIHEETTKALGHKYKETEHVDATCEEDGHITTVCSRCKDEQIEVLPALGHDVELVQTKAPTCTESGEKTGICKICEEEIKESIPSLGHDYPEEWNIDKEASIFSEGSQSKTCEECGEKIEEIIPKKEVPTAVYAGAAGTVSLGAVGFFFLKKAGKIGAKKVIEESTKDIVKDVVEEVVENEISKPSFEERTIVTCIKKDEFYHALKIQKYLSIVECEYEELVETINDSEANLTLIDVSEMNLDEVQETLQSIKDECEEAVVSLLVSQDQIDNQKDLLEEFKTNEFIKGYADVKNNHNVNLVKLVLPILKPDWKSDEGLENIGMVADALGIPAVSTLLSMYTSGREVKETYEGADEEEGLSFVDKSTIVSDIASILGLDTLSSIAGLVGDVDDIKSSLEAKIGGNEISTTKDAVEDIIDVVSDVISND